MARVLETKDLLLQSPNVESAKYLLEYYFRNKTFLEDFEPNRECSFFTYENHYNQLQKEAVDFDLQNAYRFYIFPKNDDKKIIGSISLNNVVWGCFLSCFLGYKLDGQYINKGYMTQAVGRIVDFAFSDLCIHRIEGNIMPKNKASLRVLEKCGFTNEGLSTKYLKINNIWEDHIHMVLINENL